MAGRGAGMTVPAWMNSNTTPGGLNTSAGGTKPPEQPRPAPTPSKANEWSEYTTPEGRKYYYNKVTKDTTWEKPDDLKSADELAVKTCPWKEYTSDTGRKYFYNHITHESSWETPPELAAAMRDGGGSGGAANVNTSPKADTKIQASEQAITKSNVSYANKKDATQAFKDMLAAVGVRSTWSWETALPHIMNDARYAALPSMGEKKQVFSEYCQQRKKTEEEDRRKKERQTRDDFIEMIKENKEVNSRLSWRKAVPFFENDPRYQLLEEKEREMLFEEYLYELEKNEREDEQRNRKEAMVKLKALLENTPAVTVRTQWRKLREMLADEPVFTSMEKIDALAVFEDHMRDLEKKETELQRFDRDRARRDSRKARDAFRELLTEKFESGELGLKTRWRDFVKMVNADTRYSGMIMTLGSTPQELFSDFLEDFEESLDKSKRVLREILKETSFNFTINTTLEEFQTSMSSNERFMLLPPNHIRHLFDDQIDKVQAKEQGNMKRKKKLLSAFKDLLKNTKDIGLSSTWIDSRPLLIGNKEFEAVDDEQEREKVFNEYIAYITRKQKEKEEKKDREKREDKGKESGEEGEEKEEKPRDRDREKDRERERDRDRERERERERDRKHSHKDKKKDKKKKKHHHRSKDSDDERKDRKKRHSLSDEERSSKRIKQEEDGHANKVKKEEKEKESEEGEVPEEKEEGETDQESPIKREKRSDA